MKIVAGMPASRAAHATAWPWLPALAATTPAARSASRQRRDRVDGAADLERRRCAGGSRPSARRRGPSAARTSRSSRRASRARRRRARSRAASMSARSARAIVRLDPEHLLEDLVDGGQRVELARAAPRRAGAELGIVGDRAARGAPSPAPTRPRRPRARGCAAAAPRAARRPRGTRGARSSFVPELVDVLAAVRLREHDRRLPVALLVEREHRAHLGQHRLRGRVIASC